MKSTLSKYSVMGYIRKHRTLHGRVYDDESIPDGFIGNVEKGKRFKPTSSHLGYVIAQDRKDAKARARKKYPKYTITHVYKKMRF